MMMKKPTFPANRVLLEGERPCTICGSGRGDHAHRDHEYTTEEPADTQQAAKWNPNLSTRSDG